MAMIRAIRSRQKKLYSSASAWRLTRFAILIIASLLSACDGAVCDNDILAESVAPDGRHIATVFERGCGATVPLLRIVSVRQATDEFDPDASASWVFSIYGKSDLTAEWLAGAELALRWSYSGEVRVKREQLGDVIVRY